MYSRWRHTPKTVSPRPYYKSRKGHNGLGSETIDFYSAECENTPMTLVCPSGSSIHIYDVLYGRMDRVTCPHTSIHDTNCKLATGIVAIHAYL